MGATQGGGDINSCRIETVGFEKESVNLATIRYDDVFEIPVVVDIFDVQFIKIWV